MKIVIFLRGMLQNSQDVLLNEGQGAHLQNSLGIYNLSGSYEDLTLRVRICILCLLLVESPQKPYITYLGKRIISLNEAEKKFFFLRNL